MARLSLPECFQCGTVCRSWRTVMLARRKLRRARRNLRRPPPLLAKLKAVDPKRSRRLEVLRSQMLARISLPDSRWPQLLEELLNQILARLSLPDCFRFGSVCRSRRTVMLAQRNLRRPPPLLAKLKKLKAVDLPSSDKNLTETKHELSFSCLVDDKFQELATKLPVVLYKHAILGPCQIGPCQGKPFGWLFVRGNHDSAADRNYLLNPISGETINLPNSADDIYSIEYQIAKEYQTAIRYKTVILSGPPCSGDCTVIGYADLFNDFHRPYYPLDMLASYKIGDKEWIPFQKPPLRALCMAFHEGELYVLCHERGNTNIYAFDPRPRMTRSLDASISKSNAKHFTDTYMVDAGEELFLVAEFQSEKKYQVFKLEERKSWIRIRDIGDRALFLSHRSAYSFCTKEIMGSNLRGNCIYFVHNFEHSYHRPYLSVYSIEDASCQKIFISSKGRQHVWLMPREW